MLNRLLFAAGTALLACTATADSQDYTVVRRLPHDTGAYTQGLVYAHGRLYESTGRFGRSDIRRVDLATGRVEARRRLPADRFGEGLALLGERLYQLTWQSGVGYVYDAETLAPVDSFRYEGEGWGLATDGTSLILSDGTATLRYLDPQTFEVTREVPVRDKGSPLSAINELEYVDGELYANVYQGDWIVRIDPGSGEVLQWFDMKTLLPEGDRTGATDVLNGIAYDASTGHFYVTGKLWPALFELQFAVPRDSASGRPSG